MSKVLFSEILPNISDEEMDNCRKAFVMFDRNGSGTIDIKELKMALASIGQAPSDEELFVMISQVDEDGSKEIEFDEFIRAIQIQKATAAKNNDEVETIDAFVALGGNFDKSGKISVDKLRSIIAEFELTIGIDKLINDVDVESTGTLDYEAFKKIIS